jgi:translation initiation factor IF-2
MAQSNLKPQFRPPIVTIMGHIDHGKTSLLDKIRTTNVANRESGGITQHIGAYQSQGITFIDTPGHAAFCGMRSRGAQITDIVVLVVSATDGVMAQTKECLNLIKLSSLPLIVALNKMDLSTASPDMVKGQLVELGFTPEEYGGSIPLIPVSAKTGLGIDKLIEEIKLHAEVMELKNEADSPLEAVVIESKMDKARGPVASIIVRKGTLKRGDIVYSENIHCKVKALLDYNRKPVSVAGPSTPVEILGFEAIPDIGSVITSTKHERKIVSPLPASVLVGEATPKLNVILKSDVEGSLEALKSSLNDDVLIVSAGVGQVSDNDVFMAQASKAQIYAFNLNVDKSVKNLAQNSKVVLFESKIIYEIIDDIQARVLRLLEPTIDETIQGEGKIIAEFSIDKVRIAGFQCTKGEISKGDLIHLKRDDKIIKDTKVEGIHQAKATIDKAKSGSEYGITFRPYVDFKINDVIISYKK